MQNRVYNTKAVVEAGLMIALVVIMMLIFIYMPVFSIFIFFILPIPITLLYIRNDFKITVASIVVSAIMISMLYDPVIVVTKVITIGIEGMAIGYCIKKNMKASSMILILSGSIFITIMTNLVVTSFVIYGGNISSFINKTNGLMQESMNRVIDYYIKMGMTKEQMEPIIKSMEMYTPKLILMMLPATIIVVSFIMAYINYNVTRAVLKKLRYDIKKLTPVSMIYINSRIGVFIASFLLLGAILQKFKIPISEYFINSSVILMKLAFTLDGMALVIYYMKNKFNLSKGVRILIIVLTVFSPLANIYAMAGLVDLIIDFRKLDPYRKVEAQ